MSTKKSNPLSAKILAFLTPTERRTSDEERELLGSVAVYLGHGCASIGARMEEWEALRDKPSVTCYKQYWRYYVGKEIAWFGYFVWSGAWSALVGCVLFGLYPFWRKYWRKIHPLRSEDSTCRA